MNLKHLFSLVRTIIASVFFLFPMSSLHTGAPVMHICTVQGASYYSPYEGENVQVRGIVTADLDQTAQKGFYIQEVNCDTKSSTSNAIFVRLDEPADLVNSGDEVQLKGRVQEYFGMSEIVAAPESLTILSQNNLLPNAKKLNPPFENPTARYYLETLEGMLVALPLGNVVGPTGSDGRTWVVISDLGIRRVFHDDLSGTGEVICVDDGGLFEITPDARVGDKVENLLGVLDYRLGEYCIQLVTAPMLQPGLPDASSLLLSSVGSWQVRMATFNLDELFDPFDDPETEDIALPLAEYNRRLQKRALAISQELQYPAILAVQEVENSGVLNDLVERPEVHLGYSVVLFEGPDVRGLDIAMLYRPDLASLVEARSNQGCTRLVDGFEPDGNNDPENPINVLTCDTNGDGILDGNRLFSRPPLTVHLWIRPEVNDSDAVLDVYPAEYYDYWFVIVHLKSKVEDGYSVKYTLPRRLEQSMFIANLVDEIRREDPVAKIVVLGDFNDTSDSQPLELLKSHHLLSAMEIQEKPDRYSYIFQGISQPLDDILFSPSKYLAPSDSHTMHINSDYPYSASAISGSPLRSSDHDPHIIKFVAVSPRVYFPVVIQ